MRQRLAHARELLDAPHHDTRSLTQSLHHVAQVNRWLGGTRAVVRELERLLPVHARSTLLDIGTGSADIPLAIARWARRTGRPVDILATDAHARMRDVARASAAREDAVRIGAADAVALPYRDRSFDVVLLSLTLHHLEDDDPVRALREAARVARRAVIVNELERGWPNYLGARFLAATLWRRNPITRHDGPISVLRAFRAAELAPLATAAGLCTEAVRRRFFYRLVLVIDARDSSAAPTE